MNSCIYFDNQSCVFTPGAMVTGNAVLRLTEATSARAVLISVEGKASTHWAVTRSGSSGTGQNRRTHSSTDHYRGLVNIAKGESVSWGDCTTKQTLPVGEHKFPFGFQLPFNCLPSYEGIYGNIRYECKLKVDRPWKFDHTCTMPFTVTTPPVHLSPLLLSPLTSTVREETGMPLFRKGHVSVEATITKGGFVPGESIDVVLEVNNTSSKDVEQIDIRLLEISDYTAFRHCQTFPVERSFVGTSFPHEYRSGERKVGKVKAAVVIPRHSSNSVKLSLRIPPVVSSFDNCAIIKVGYMLKVTVTTKASFKSSVDVRLPIVVGNVPMMSVTAPNAPFMQEIPSVPTAPPLPSPEAPPYEEASMAPPPTYEESVFGLTQPSEEEEKGVSFAPRYPYYGHLGENTNGIGENTKM